jgi:hypothetical protein
VAAKKDVLLHRHAGRLGFQFRLFAVDNDDD